MGNAASAPAHVLCHTTPQQSRPQGPPRLRPRARLALCHSNTTLHSNSYRDFLTSERRIQPTAPVTPAPNGKPARPPLAHTLSSNSAAGTTGTPVTTPGSDAKGPTLRPNRKFIDLPGLNTFAAPAVVALLPRGWLAREGRGSGSTTNGNGSISVNVNINGGYARGGVRRPRRGPPPSRYPNGRTGTGMGRRQRRGMGSTCGRGLRGGRRTRGRRGRGRGGECFFSFLPFAFAFPCYFLAGPA
ncbi:hypothetical protein B0H14DRAFT_26058 [Mycena olivaceomarginata]|nr:hypothetical protein B0H14DRAFT_26058 [Mycena olivaceomarginata]